MLETTQQSRSPVQIDPATHAECLEFIRAAIASNDRHSACRHQKRTSRCLSAWRSRSRRNLGCTLRNRTAAIPRIIGPAACCPRLC